MRLSTKLFVDAIHGGGSDTFQSLSDVLNNAVSGDTIVVRSGMYICDCNLGYLPHLTTRGGRIFWHFESGTTIVSSSSDACFRPRSGFTCTVTGYATFLCNKLFDDEGHECDFNFQANRVQAEQMVSQHARSQVSIRCNVVERMNANTTVSFVVSCGVLHWHTRRVNINGSSFILDVSENCSVTASFDTVQCSECILARSQCFSRGVGVKPDTSMPLSITCNRVHCRELFEAHQGTSRITIKEFQCQRLGDSRGSSTTFISFDSGVCTAGHSSCNCTIGHVSLCGSSLLVTGPLLSSGVLDVWIGHLQGFGSTLLYVSSGECTALLGSASRQLPPQQYVKPFFHFSGGRVRLSAESVFDSFDGYGFFLTGDGDYCCKITFCRLPLASFVISSCTGVVDICASTIERTKGRIMPLETDVDTSVVNVKNSSANCYLKVDSLVLSSTLEETIEDVHCLSVSSASVHCTLGTVFSDNPASVIALSGEETSFLSISSLEGAGTLIASSQHLSAYVAKAKTNSLLPAFDITSSFFLTAQEVESNFAVRCRENSSGCLQQHTSSMNISANALSGRIVLENCKAQLCGSSWAFCLEAQNSNYTLSCQMLRELHREETVPVVLNKQTRCRILCSFFEALHDCIVCSSSGFESSSMLLGGTFVSSRGNVVRADRSYVLGVLPSSCLSSASRSAVDTRAIVCNLGSITVSPSNCIWQQPHLVTSCNIPTVFLDSK